MRVGAILLAARALAPREYSEANAGRAMQAPMLRKKWRRLKLACRSAARERSVFMSLSVMSIRHRGRCLGSHFLERRRLDDAHQQCREAAVVGVEPVHDLIDGFHVVILRAPPGRVGQKFPRQRLVELLAVSSRENTLEFRDAAERFTGNEVAGSRDGLLALRIAPHAER